MTALLRRLWGSPRAPRRQTPVELFALADRRRRDGRPAEAARLVQAGLALDPENLTGHLLAAYLHLAARTIEPARGEFAWILRRDPAHPRALLGLARIALEEGDVATCRESLTRALRIYPDFPEAQALLGATAARPVPAAAAPAPPPPVLDRLRVPPLARALLIIGPDGEVLTSRPGEAASQGERLARAVRLAAAALRSARLGAPRRAVVDTGDESYFVRIDTALTAALALPRTTQITQGLLEVNRVWAAARHDRVVRAETAPRSAGTGDSARRVS
ncbi:MAG TPA: tetratricopeptide repeat protein [Candidatus Binatia bacterium]|nr:tetratricopeptide repeat protein [Candidatus Binatia bacterium]